MGKLNLLKSSWTGKVGQTVGAKWKDKAVIRTLTIPTYTDTPAQHTIRQGFGDITSFLALFCDRLRTLTSWDTRGMSVRNAIIKYNKDIFTGGAFSPANLIISRGGIPKPAALTITAPAGLDSLSVSWTPIAAPTISAKAKTVIVAANRDNGIGIVGSGPYATGSLSIAATLPPSAQLDCYYYLLDYRGSSRVCSLSSYTAVMTPSD